VASNIIFLDSPPPTDFNERKRIIYEALRKGRVAVSFDLIHPFSGNDWFLECGGTRYRSGDTVKLDNCRFHMQLPENFPYDASLRLKRDGQLAREIPIVGKKAAFPATDPGVYRLEVLAHLRTPLGMGLGRPVPYVYYNPIYVR
jgi:hypothetical protein